MANGTEILLQSTLKMLGLGGAVDQAKALVEAGALSKIMDFAKQLGEHTAAINRLADVVEADLHARGIEVPERGQPLGIAVERRSDTGGASGPVLSTPVALGRTGTD